MVLVSYEYVRDVLGERCLAASTARGRDRWVTTWVVCETTEDDDDGERDDKKREEKTKNMPDEVRDEEREPSSLYPFPCRNRSGEVR